MTVSVVVLTTDARGMLMASIVSPTQQANCPQQMHTGGDRSPDITRRHILAS